jgi:hypothetical protein
MIECGEVVMTTRHRRTAARRFTSIVITVCATLVTVLAQSSPGTFAHRRLEDALRVLQSRGLRLVFSSELVTSDMRVDSEPRATTPEEQLNELLEPHGLTAETGPGGVMQVVRQKRQTVVPRRTRTAKRSKAADDTRETRSPDSTYHERVTVTGNLDGTGEMNVGVDRRLTSYELGQFGSHIADDPLRVVQTLPGVAGGDDFRSEYSVRGSPYRHASLIVDGVETPWLQHAAVGRGDTGTMTMLRGDMVQDATLVVGAYPRRDGGQLGPQLNLTLREGSRAARRFHASVSGTSTTLTAEGPLGSSARGSWIAGLRKSHVEWPVGRDDHQSTVFGFGDLQSKLVYDVRPGQQVSVSLVAGLSNVERDNPNPLALADGVNTAAMATVGWRSVIGSRTIVTQRISYLTHEFVNRDQTTRPASRGANGANAYRLDVTRTLFRGALEAGAQAKRVWGARGGPMAYSPISGATMESPVNNIDASWLERSGYASFRRSVAPGVTLAAGLRLAGSTLVHRDAVDRWFQAEWAVGPRWLLHGSTGLMHQFPDLERVRGWAGADDLRPERATYADVGVGQRLSPSVRWDATMFTRRERDILRDADLPRVVNGVIAFDGVTNRFGNVLAGSARGFELTLERRDSREFAGWVGYTYGVARYSDATRHETFDADFDQRHTVNVSGVAPAPWGTRVGFTFRSGTNFPIPGYLVNRDGRLFAGERPNEARLPAYARLDLRAERTFDRAGRHFTLFAEAINVLNRTNVGLADGAIIRDTGEAVGFTERLYPRLATAGVRCEF